MRHTPTHPQDDRTVQDKAFDLLGEMLIERDTAAFLKQLEAEEASGGNPQMDAFFARQERVHLQRIDAHCRHRRSLGQSLGRIGRIAAALILVVFLTGGAAIAASPTLRVHVMRLLIQPTQEYTALSLVEDEDSAFDVPAQWQGSCFPSYLPDDMQLFQCLSMAGFSFITYQDIHDDTLKIHFSEADANSVTQLDTENALVRPITILAHEGYIATKGNTVHIFWSDGVHYYIVSTVGFDEDTARQVAQSIKKIVF